MHHTLPIPPPSASAGPATDHPDKEQPMAKPSTAARRDRTAARVIGVLYIIGTVAFVLSAIVSAGALGPGVALDAPASRDALVAGALLVLVAGFALAMVPVAFWPIGRRHDETLAMGYVVIRGAIETVLYIGIALGWLLLPMLAAAPGGEVLAGLARDAVTISAEQLLGIPFALGALLFYVLLFRARLVPRWLSGWGLVGASLYLAAPVASMLGMPLGFLMGPLAVQEMALAAWLIAKGFNEPALAQVTGDRLDRPAAAQVAAMA